MKILDKIVNYVTYQLVKKLQAQMIGYSSWNKDKVHNLRIGSNTHISNSNNIKLNNNTYIGYNNYIDGYCKIKIHEGVQITNNVQIVTHSSHNSIRILGDNYYSPNKINDSGNIEIGKYSYIGPFSIIMPGVKIGKGCVISAFSYVNQDIEDYSIVRGQPAIKVGDTKDIDIEILKKYPEENTNYYDY